MAAGMRLLSSAHSGIAFSDHRAPLPPYAILSHVWNGAEQSYKDLLHLQLTATAIDDLRVSIKVRECSPLATEYGLDWFWVDAPCIDKRNSAELSEAISSMYHWYGRSAICFVHLPDVPSDSRDHIRAPGSAFRLSVYFKRGWTLQELVAARRVVFLFNDWTVLSIKHELANVLEEITGIDYDILTFCRFVFIRKVGNFRTDIGFRALRQDPKGDVVSVRRVHLRGPPSTLAGAVPHPNTKNPHELGQSREPGWSPTHAGWRPAFPSGDARSQISAAPSAPSGASRAGWRYSRFLMFDVSVARRLSWASHRETRRVEDRAYCLLGLFNIHMPIMYGEGNKAFIRLQQTILAEIRDHTLFAWGAAMDMTP
ncbi:hypothetical protein BC628DRAFT_1417955 [Trametes gibbosa]|nr:hypothetical protein BC628DRAFT_1417955 [Trametes gibbosa]